MEPQLRHTESVTKITRKPVGRPKLHEDHKARQAAYLTRKKAAALAAKQERNDSWETPQDLFVALNAEFSFSLDVAASDLNHKCLRYFTKDNDGLSQDWSGETCWCNPPYSNVGPWLEKAVTSAKYGATVVFLLPFAPSRGWWQKWVKPHASEVRDVPRLKFVGAQNKAPFDVGIIVYRPGA